VARAVSLVNAVVKSDEMVACAHEELWTIEVSHDGRVVRGGLERVADTVANACDCNAFDRAIEHKTWEAGLADKIIRYWNATVAIIKPTLGGAARHRHPMSDAVSDRATMLVIGRRWYSLAGRLTARVRQHHVIHTPACAAWGEVAVATVAFTVASFEASHVAAAKHQKPKKLQAPRSLLKAIPFYLSQSNAMRRPMAKEDDSRSVVHPADWAVLRSVAELAAISTCHVVAQ
jgi:hypothetical protein